MDENEARVGGYGGDPTEQFHREEAISAVVDDGFVGEEDDEYEDLYNDVNVGENFLHSLRKNEDNSGHRNGEPVVTQEKVIPQQQLVGQSGVPGLQDQAALSRVPDRVEGYQNVGYKINEIGFGRGTGAPVGDADSSRFKVELGQSTNVVANLEHQMVSSSVPNKPQMVGNFAPTNPQMLQNQQPHAAYMGNVQNIGHSGNGVGGNLYAGSGEGRNVAGGAVVVGGGRGSGGGTFLFVGDLHWWTTDSELESELCKYGPVKEVKFFDERASGKSKGYCQVEFYHPASATSCKEGMNGHVFNGRPCVVAHASPFSVKKMGEAQVNRNQQQMGEAVVSEPRRGPGDFQSRPVSIGNNNATGGNHQGGGENNGRGFGRGNWGRGNNSQGGMGNRGHMGPMRGRAGGMSFRGLAGNGNGFGQGIGAGPSPMMHPQNMMGQGFDPTFGNPMGRMGTYGGFPGAPTAPFPGIMSPFGPMGNVGLPGVAPHVNPAFFGRGMPLTGMGMHNPGVDGSNMGMWPDQNMGGWAGDQYGGRAGDSGYGEEAASEQQYVDESQERGSWPNATKEKDNGSEKDWSGSPERGYQDERGAGYDREPVEKDTGRDQDFSGRRQHDDRDVGRDREREKERGRDRELSRDHTRDREREQEHRRDDRDRYVDYRRHGNREAEYDDERDRGRSRTYSKSRISHEEHHRSRSRDVDYGKRRHLSSE